MEELMKRTIPALVLTMAWSAAAPAQDAQDVAGSADPAPIGKRFPDAVIVDYALSEFDEAVIPTGPAPKRETIDIAVRAEGRVTTVQYRIGRERTTLEVMRNYEAGLKELGFETLYACADKDCGGRYFNHNILDAIYGGYVLPFGDNYGGQRYLAARKPGAAGAGDVYAMVYVIKNSNSGGPTQDMVYAAVRTVETKAMETALVVVKAEQIQSELTAKGSIALYGILFDFDKANLKEESRPALDEIARFLSMSPAQNVYVVGHTDNKGALDYNLDLSKRRAEAVVETLVVEYGIDAARLQAHGVADLSPVAPNATDDGRALNRRVVIVAR
jgi:outer membrane protein OmpA-like peptidoglycan-associated protein